MSDHPAIGAFDSEAFDALMADVDQPLIIVTTASRDVRAGCLVGFHAQAGIDPVEYAVWLSKANHTYRVGALSEHFAVHFLSKEHHDLAELFGGHTQEQVDKFAQCDWSPGPNGVPLLDRVTNRFVDDVTHGSTPAPTTFASSSPLWSPTTRAPPAGYVLPTPPTSTPAMTPRSGSARTKDASVRTRALLR